MKFVEFAKTGTICGKENVTIAAWKTASNARTTTTVLHVLKAMTGLKDTAFYANILVSLVIYKPNAPLARLLTTSLNLTPLFANLRRYLSVHSTVKLTIYYAKSVNHLLPSMPTSKNVSSYATRLV